MKKSIKILVTVLCYLIMFMGGLLAPLSPSIAISCMLPILLIIDMWKR